MRYIAAYLLLQLGGNTSPSAADIKKVLSAVGIESEEERLDKLLSELSGKDINTLISEGSSKLSSVPSGGGAAAASAAPAAGGAAPAAEKEEEKKEEEKEESDDDMGFGLFD
ncbi:60s acidic ribosomal protein-domain-containing protein [Lentinula edodes]|uniref:60s acidic ribosomal protein-domain-containing protein n=2 Tax=Lentinula TaxID=5352 RepID=A0A9W9B1Z2_9AGAR|nr:60s acidic ribosomal protein-domain-containing protein [Lentinula edodes]KAJ3809053.1 60s acidic ribosomal protein-domain-containing protein [Lentinula aff. lateritia]KAJ3852773.1 60s acidic ribosomal protein-domain-containing protein [Lentinula lateritia]KAH7879093.1 60s acidic ribosomal protein-domain-containing protein [Lentinula edodes]KAJ3879822.1 60s acidic ribosomal protein-domain-containing protein [Lentinula edodes]KAJ3891110.1 60s acidic ribosomal protein-domain-containing protein